MNTARTSHPVERAPSRHRFVDRAAELKGIHRHDVNALIWRRSLDPQLRDQARALLSRGPGMILDIHCRPDQVRERLHGAIDRAPFRIHRLAYDLERLAHNFAVVAHAISVRLQLEVLAHQPCPLFHVDNNVLRMVCSYTGPGTEYADDRFLNRDRLRCGDNEGVLAGHPPLALESGSVILMKGERSPTCGGLGAVHRSPPVAGDQQRLLVRLDHP
ncbi:MULTISPECIES: DUF1826 domain-containing protein [unclassified Thioalkalivibrio]|uniref:DUF1826 domain-containing protein n=1 Tax=unclassified Thioalkalivibrio TaxID=2621013 RepID=UPI0003802CFA|nr:MULTISPECIES: DUF1826 domain-containing protein [unclassified Thioalkalivibrio]